MKKTYIKPTLLAVQVTQRLLLDQSNKVNDNSVTLNPNTMDSGNGSDAVKSHSYNVWDDDWQ